MADKEPKVPKSKPAKRGDTFTHSHPDAAMVTTIVGNYPGREIVSKPRPELLETAD